MEQVQQPRKVVIREAHGETDLAAVRRLMLDYGRFLSQKASICLGSSYETELASLPAGYDALLLAEVDDAPAGCLALHEIPRPGERACEMKRLWVDDSFRGLRLGKLLLQRGLDWATDRGYQTMYLDTVPAAMPEANRLYAAFDFRPVERYNSNPVAGVEFFARPLGNVR